jgi:hypothetical protein
MTTPHNSTKGRGARLHSGPVYTGFLCPARMNTTVHLTGWLGLTVQQPRMSRRVLTMPIASCLYIIIFLVLQMYWKKVPPLGCYRSNPVENVLKAIEQCSNKFDLNSLGTGIPMKNLYIPLPSIYRCNPYFYYSYCILRCMESAISL